MRLLQNSIFAGLAWLLLCALELGCSNGNKIPNHVPDLLRLAQASRPDPDLLDSQSKDLAGPDAIDCGRVHVKDDPKAATDCVLKAQSKGKPFRVRYDLMGFDSEVAVAIVRTPVGTVGTLQYDSDVSGSGSYAPSISPKRCPEPVHLWVNPGGRINCFQQQSSPPRDAMSPNAEAY